MGNEVSTVGGAVATAATSVAAGVTFGQVDALNNAVVECSKFTADAASKTVVRHVGETVGTAVATGAVAVAAGATFGQVDALNQTVVNLGKHSAESAVQSGKAMAHTANDVANGVPVVGHIKGGIHYALGDKEGGDQAMKSASRTTGVVIGGVIGIPGGPAGMVAGGITGGAVMDGITTGVESAVKGEYTPSGQIKAWTDVAKGKDAQTVVGGVVGGFMSPVMDGVGGYAAGSFAKGRAAAALEQDLAGFEVANEAVPRNPNPALNQFMAEQQGNVGTGAAAAASRAGRSTGRSVGGASEAASGASGSARSGAGQSGSEASGGSRPSGSGGSSSSASSSTSWKSALSKGEGSIISLAELEDTTLYTGVNRGENPYSPAGVGEQLGAGIYFTDNLELACDYATVRYEPHYVSVPGEVYRFQFRGAEWQEYMKYWSRQDGGTVRHLINVEDFQIIKTGHGGANQYRFSPHIAEALAQRGALVKIRDVQ